MCDETDPIHDRNGRVIEAGDRVVVIESGAHFNYAGRFGTVQSIFPEPDGDDVYWAVEVNLDEVICLEAETITTDAESIVVLPSPAEAGDTDRP